MPTQTNTDFLSSQPDSSASGKSSHADLLGSLPDTLADLTKGEGGLYKMVGPGNETKDIPYSNIMTAASAGWKMPSSVRERYARDRRAEVVKEQQVHGYGPNMGKVKEQDYLKAMQLPEELSEEKTPSLWRQFGNWVQKETEPTSLYPGVPTSPTDPATAEFGINTAKRVGRVLFGLPDFGVQAFSALSDAMSADPKKAADGESRLLSMHPSRQITGRVKELRDDARKDPKLAASNVTGDVIGMWLAGKAMEVPGKTLGYVTETAPLKSIAKVVKATGADLKFGKNPAQAILEEGIVGNDLHQLGERTFDKIHEVGRGIDALVDEYEQTHRNMTIDLTHAMKPIDDAMAKAHAEHNPGLYKRLSDLKTQLEYNAKIVRGTAIGDVSLEPDTLRNLRTMTPTNALEFKRIVGDKVTWTGLDPYEKPANGAAMEVYGNIRESLDKTVPGLKDLNRRYSNLVAAGKAIERQIPVAQRHATWSLIDIGVALGGHPIAAVARKIMLSPAFRTRVAGGLYGMVSHGPIEPPVPRRFGTPPRPPYPPKYRGVGTARWPIEANLPLRGAGATAAITGANADRAQWAKQQQQDAEKAKIAATRALLDSVPDSLASAPGDQSAYDEMRAATASEQGVDPSIMTGLQVVENKSQNPTAINYNTNGTFDFGLMQINSATYRAMVDPSASDEQIKQALGDPQYNYKLAAQIVKKAMGLSNKPEDIAAFYHTGGIYKDAQGNYIDGSKKPITDYIQRFTAALGESASAAQKPAVVPQPTALDPSLTMAVQNPAGLITPGNIPIWDRPVIQNADGSHSTDLTISIGDDLGHEILIPMIVDGKFLTPDGKMPPGPVPEDWDNAPPAWKALRDEAIKHYRETGEHFGIFDSVPNANAYAAALHNRPPAKPTGAAPMPQVVAEAKLRKPTPGKPLVVVADPHGKRYGFQNQEAADKFKSELGLQ